MLPSLSRVWRPVVHDSLPRVTRSGLSPAVTKWFDLIQGTHKTGVLEAFTKGALVTDGGQTYRERRAIQGWLTGRRVHHHLPLAVSRAVRREQPSSSSRGQWSDLQ